MNRRKIISACMAAALIFMPFANERVVYAAENQSTNIVENSEGEEQVNVVDGNLRNQICKELNKESGSTLTKKDMAAITSLEASYWGVSSLEGLQYCTNLESLVLTGNHISDLSPISKLKNITKLDLSQNYDLKDISPLSSLTSLTSINLIHDQITDLSSLSGLTNLSELYIAENKIRDISPLAGLSRLKALDLENAYYMDHECRPLDISPLATLTELEKLDIQKNSIKDISELKVLSNLTDLNLQVNDVTDAAPLEGLEKLTKLNLEFNRITSNISKLSSLTNLKTLDLSYTKISDISFLKSLKNLTNLSALNNDLEDISAIESLTNLEKLDLSSNKIKDITKVKSLVNLKSLNLNSNQIKSVVPIVSLTNLEEVYLGDNNISDISSLNKLKLNGYNKKLFLNDQKVNLTAKLENGEINIVNPIINLKGGSCTYLSEISNGGKFDKNTNVINYKNVKAGDKVAYKFNIENVFNNTAGGNSYDDDSEFGGLPSYRVMYPYTGVVTITIV